MDLIEQINHLYTNEQLSTSQISKKLNMTHGSVINIMRKNSIPRRTPAETNRINFLRSPLSYSKKIKLTKLEKELKTAGIMLYWAEGKKAGIHTVDFANSDPKMICLFLFMLRHIYQVKEDKLRILLYCFANQNIANLISYWSNILKIPSSQFIKPYVRQDYDPNKLNKMRYGLVHICYSDKRLLMEIKQEIDIIATNLC